ncbi:MAG: tRNA pseudouridine(38-40) synthase TruA [Flavisolibacter sp.]
MPRYFLEVSYKGTAYSGFQIQENAITIQSEVAKAFQILHRNSVALTGSSRTDAGVHALQNFFHFDYDSEINPKLVYKMNAILPSDIVVKDIYAMLPKAHSRFDATSREYVYRLHRSKNPFLENVSYFFPYKLDVDLMQQAAAIVKGQTNFFAFSKTNTQVKNFNCKIFTSQWLVEGEELIYNIEGNRFLRGMVRLLTASLLKVGRQKMSLEQFKNLFEQPVKCGLSLPSEGLFLQKVNFPENYFPLPGLRFKAF